MRGFLGELRSILRGNGLAACAIGLAMFAALAPARGSQTMVDSPYVTPGGDFEVHGDQLFEQFPNAGIMPLRLKIINRAERPRKLEVKLSEDANSGANKTEWTIEIPPRATVERTLYAPLISPSDGSWRRISLRGSGSSGESFTFATVNTGNRGASLHVIAGDLGASSVSDLNKEAGKASPQRFSFASLSVDQVPPSWKAYLGARSLSISSGDYAALTPEARSGIRDWVAQGGHLILCGPQVEDADLTALFPNTTPLKVEHPHAFGFGTVQMWAHDGKEPLALPAYEQRFKDGAPHTEGFDAVPSSESSMPDGFRTTSLHEGVPAPDLPRKLTLVLLCAFAILLGPLNVFLLAGTERRIRLFITTPLLAIGLAVIGFVCIYFKDGVGGKGNRVTLIAQVPGAPRAFVLQEQVSTCGLLGNTSFRSSTSSDEFMLRPIFLLDAREGRENFNTDAAGTFSGSWFKSRSKQGQQIQAFHAGRAGFSLVESGANTPKLISSFPDRIDSAVLIDPSGVKWLASGITPGAKVNLVRLDTEDETVRTIVNRGGWRTRNLLWNFTGEENNPRAPGASWRYIASRSGGSPELLATLGSIRWSDTTLYAGSITP